MAPIGLASVRPRPMKRARSVSNCQPVPRRFAVSFSCKRQAMGDIEGRIIFAPGSPVGQQCLLLRDCLGLDEKLVEGRMLAVGIMRRHREFNIAGKVEAAGSERSD